MTPLDYESDGPQQCLALGILVSNQSCSPNCCIIDFISTNEGASMQFGPDQCDEASLVRLDTDEQQRSAGVSLLHQLRFSNYIFVVKKFSSPNQTIIYDNAIFCIAV